MYKAAIYLFGMRKESALWKPKADNDHKHHRIQKSHTVITLIAWRISRMSFFPLLLLPVQSVT